ncbi:unnamed protein product [Toxocara canis]|uniref:PhoU domain-containing protein n=1 Tax=Toxocara canis TaxID=6265 RepID=A0A183V5Z2_TOXCA|nr:unnamed protein product [Toxocara canis]
MELERSIRLSPDFTVDKLGKVITKISDLIADDMLNISSDENDLFKMVNYDLVVLLRIITEIQEYCKLIERIDYGNSIEDRKKIAKNVDEHSLKDRIAKNIENMQHLIRWIGKKTERRWWFTDAINFLQVFVKLALLISAAISVVYHEYQAAPIVTLAITIVHGVVDMLDQFFVNNITPKAIKLSIINAGTPQSPRTSEMLA